MMIATGVMTTGGRCYLHLGRWWLLSGAIWLVSRSCINPVLVTQISRTMTGLGALVIQISFSFSYITVCITPPSSPS